MLKQEINHMSERSQLLVPRNVKYFRENERDARKLENDYFNNAYNQINFLFSEL